MTYKDTVTLAEMVSDGYGDKSLDTATEIQCLFLQSSGETHAGNVTSTTSDAHAYLNHVDPVVLDKGYRLEGMFIKATPFGTPDDESWYKITRVEIGQRKLLENDVDNVHVFLQKVAKP